MPEVNYKVDLFYGDVGFTSDYSNVLQFDSANARDSYFDAISEKDNFDNTDFNNIQLSGNTIKLAFVDSTQIARLEKYNYIRILTRLYGTLDSASKYDYGFIVDYTIISSNSNVTVVEFTFETDIWQNFQFDFELKECNVERSHMDRWNANDNKMEFTRPGMDLLDSFMKVLNSEKINNKAMAYVINQSGGLVSDIQYKEIEFALAVVSYTSGTTMGLLYFPIAVNEEVFIVNKVVNGDKYLFPSIGDITSGVLQTMLGLPESSVNNLKILYNPSMYLVAADLTTNISGAYLSRSNYEGNAYFCSYGISTSYATDAFRDSKTITPTISKPVKPVDGANHSNTYEPMLYKAPVLKRYITNYDGSEQIQIPDVILDDVNSLKIMTFASHVECYNIINLINTEDTTKLRMINASGIISAYDGDVANSPWKEYCMTQRESDRNIMWANILTGGLADAGSTAISAGIGYRSNAERSFMYETLGTGTRQDKAMSGMFDKYAKQAAAMSIAGGTMQYAASGIGSYVSQENKELAIKNKPATMSKTGNALTSLLRRTYGIYYTETICDEDSYEQYANIFNKFGYFIGTIIKPNIKSRKYFNYLKTNGAILTGSLNQSVLAKLCRIFDNGVTIWHMDYTTKATLYNYDKENIERTLIGE